VDFPAIKDTPPTVLFTVRNAEGKFMWKATLNLFAEETSTNPVIATSSLPPNVKPIRTDNTRPNSDEEKDKYSWMNSIKVLSALDVIEKLDHNEFSYLLKHNYRLILLTPLYGINFYQIGW